MATTQRQKYGNLQVIDGGLAQTRTPEAKLEREGRELFAAVRGEDGKVPARAFYEIAEGSQAPWRVLARRVREMKAGRVSLAVAKITILRPLDRYIERVYGEQPTGEFPRAA